MAEISDSFIEEVETEVAVSEEIKNRITFTDEQYEHLLNQRILLLNDVCDLNIVERMIMPLLEMDNDGTGKEITIYISTNGGSVYDTLPLCNVIERLKSPTKIIVLGYAYSMGSILMMAGFNNPNVKRYCYPFSSALIHGGSSYISGTSRQVKDYYKFNEKFEDRIKQFILSHTNDCFTEDDYNKIDEGYESYLDSDEMLRIGLVDSIL